MFNVLKKTLKKEFGRQKYEQYAEFIKNNVRTAKTDHTEIFNDIYEDLQKKDADALAGMQERLNESLLASFQISRSYVGAFVAYLVAFVIISSYAVQMVAVPGLIVISGMFLVKTVEYVANKFCYVDAHMIMIYKSVLDRILRERKISLR